MRLGAVGIIALLSSINAHSSTARAGELSCNSIDGELSRCALPGADKLKVKLKLDRAGACKNGDTWGVDKDGLWVDMGCQAVFTYKDAHARPWWRGMMPSLHR